jgi:hypothetical protein
LLPAISSTLRDDVSSTLRDGGLIAAAEPEALFHGRTLPPVEPTVFDVRRATTDLDRDGIQRVFTESHGYEPELVASMWGPALLDRPDVGGWVAWDADEPVSCVFVTRVGARSGSST